MTDIDRALTAQRVDAKPHPSKNVDTTFGIYTRQDGELAMGNEVVQINRNKRTSSVDDTEYDFTPGRHALIMSKHPRPTQYDSNDYRVYKTLCAQTKVRSFPNPAGAARPHATWKYKYMRRKMVIPGERIEEEEESEDTDDTAPMGGEPSAGILEPDFTVLPLPAHTRSYGKAKKEKDENIFIKVTNVKE